MLELADKELKEDIIKEFQQLLQIMQKRMKKHKISIKKKTTKKDSNGNYRTEK